MAHKVFFLGDSLTQGLWDTRGGWASRLIGDLHKASNATSNHADYMGYNLGIGGDTSTGLRGRVERELRPRFGVDEQLIGVVAIGANDVRPDQCAPTLEATVARYRQNIEWISGVLTQCGMEQLFVGTSVVDEEFLHPFDGLPVGLGYRNEHLEALDVELQAFCRSNDVGFVGLRAALDARPRTDVLAEGLHPNDRGHEIIARQVRRVLFPMLQLPADD